MKLTIIKEFPGQAVEEYRKENDGKLPSGEMIPRFHATSKYRFCDARCNHWSGGVIDRLNQHESRYCQHFHTTEKAALVCAAKMMSPNAVLSSAATEVNPKRDV